VTWAYRLAPWRDMALAMSRTLVPAYPFTRNRSLATSSMARRRETSTMFGAAPNERSLGDDTSRRPRVSTATAVPREPASTLRRHPATIDSLARGSDVKRSLPLLALTVAALLV